MSILEGKDKSVEIIINHVMVVGMEEAIQPCHIFGMVVQVEDQQICEQR